LSAKRQGLVTDISRPESLKLDLDFQTKGLDPYKKVTNIDVKIPISLKGKAVSESDTYSKIGHSRREKLIQ